MFGKYHGKECPILKFYNPTILSFKKIQALIPLNSEYTQKVDQFLSHVTKNSSIIRNFANTSLKTDACKNDHKCKLCDKRMSKKKRLADSALSKSQS